MSHNAVIRIIRHFIRVMRKYFPDKQISGFYFAALYRDIPLLEYWNELPQQFFTSASKRVGRTEILEYIEGLAKAGILEFKQI